MPFLAPKNMVLSCSILIRFLPAPKQIQAHEAESDTWLWADAEAEVWEEGVMKLRPDLGCFG